MLSKNLLFYLLQCMALGLLFWIIQVLMPVIVDTLLQGMAQWNTATKLYCWIIQIFFLWVSFFLRAYLFTLIEHRVVNKPAVIRYFMMFGALIVVLFGLYLIVSKLDGLSFSIEIEVGLLLLQIYYLVGMAAPMGRVMFTMRKG